MTLNRFSSRSLQLRSNILITVYGMQQHWADTRSTERIYFLFQHRRQLMRLRSLRSHAGVWIP